MMRRRLTTWETCKYTAGMVAAFAISCAIVGAVLWRFRWIAWALLGALILFLVLDLTREALQRRTRAATRPERAR